VKELVAKREELAAKQKALHVVFEEAGPELDMKKIKAIDGDVAHKRAEILRMNNEMTALGVEIDGLAGIEKAKKDTEDMGERLNTPAHMPFSGEQTKQFKSLGQLFTESVAYKNRVKDGFGPTTELPLDMKVMERGVNLKALMSTTAGWAPQAIRTDIVIPFALTPIQVLDMIPTGETTQASVVFMEETTSTSGAVETAEGGAYGQSTLVFTERTSNVRKVATFLPVTDEQLEDIPQVQGFVDNRLVFFLRQRLDKQVLVGDGIAPNLKGIINVAGIQTQAKAADPTPDAIYKALVKVNFTGFADASLVVEHPLDWQSLRLLRTAEGVYIWGSPSDAGPARIWGLPVAQSSNLTQGTGIVGDFRNFCELDYRRGIEVQVGYVNDDFSKGQKSIRADVRAAFPVYRPAAFCTVTGQ
jgi:HK97 family phage major capsid protein